MLWYLILLYRQILSDFSRFAIDCLICNSLIRTRFEYSRFYAYLKHQEFLSWSPVRARKLLIKESEQMFVIACIVRILHSTENERFRPYATFRGYTCVDGSIKQALRDSTSTTFTRNYFASRQDWSLITIATRDRKKVTSDYCETSPAGWFDAIDQFLLYFLEIICTVGWSSKVNLVKWMGQLPPPDRLWCFWPTW